MLSAVHRYSDDLSFSLFLVSLFSWIFERNKAVETYLYSQTFNTSQAVPGISGHCFHCSISKTTTAQHTSLFPSWNVEDDSFRNYNKCSYQIDLVV